MKIRYFADTDTLYFELREGEITETRDLDPRTLMELDAAGEVVALTFEHARTRADEYPRSEVRTAFQAFVARALGFWPKMGRAAPNPAPARSRVLSVRRNNQFSMRCELEKRRTRRMCRTTCRRRLEGAERCATGRLAVVDAGVFAGALGGAAG